MKEEVEQCNKTSKKTTVTTTGSKCTIHPLYASDSGEYWCGTAGGKRSNIISITVTAGSVILESPAVPVMEGEDVTLRCRNKMSSSNIAADFYKNGVHNRSSSSGSMTIQGVLKSDEGLYKCKIAGAGESPKSWLSVSLPCFTDSHNKRSHCAATTPWIVVTILLSTLIAVVGLYHFRKDLYRVIFYWSTMACGSGSTEDQTGQNTNNEVELCPNPVYHSLDQGDTQPPETVKTTVAYMASPGIYQAVAEDACYSTIP
ncbi:low affinity immunoglobulin gamma Fc region receptor II-a-like isoform X1 [Simochromis diagramma]|uniref:low affinity immunoglobulin gamma Fc region receptor II-a-like isoform X1 n=1 Tax=Simochromis diagramma TaxID=43689 RepID=UPI001A7E717B|nr:low affinity immunoglobulin gamma Fc region receptor II-a-like isoform X1 [Simochromis diagramma]